VDVLIISQEVPVKAIEKAKIKAAIEERLNLPPYHPFEIHLLTPQEARPYLRRANQHVLKM
jgi:predicted nucleotidyltransferase